MSSNISTHPSSIELTQRNDARDEQQNEESQFLKFSSSKKPNPQQEFDARIEKVKDWATYLRDKLESLAWISAAVAVIYYSNFFHIFFYHEKINLIFSNIFLGCIALNAVFAFYSAVILPYFLKIKEPVDKYQPKIIYIGAITGFIGFFSLIIAIWPAFGWYSPFMVFAMFIGFLNCASFLPSNEFGSLLFALIFIGAFYSHYFIKHDGHLHSQL